MLTVTSVGALGIIKKWGGVERITKKGLIISEPTREYIKTNVDNKKIPEEDYTSDWMTIKEVEQVIGVNVISIKTEYIDKEYESNYHLSRAIVQENDLVQAIYIRQNGQLDGEERLFSLDATILTSNFPDQFAESFSYDIGYTYEELEYIEKVYLKNIDTEATIYNSYLYVKTEDRKEFYQVDFTKDSIKYELKTFGRITYEELLDILNTLEY